MRPAEILMFLLVFSLTVFNSVYLLCIFDMSCRVLLWSCIGV